MEIIFNGSLWNKSLKQFTILNIFKKTFLKYQTPKPIVKLKPIYHFEVYWACPTILRRLMPTHMKKINLMFNFFFKYWAFRNPAEIWFVDRIYDNQTRHRKNIRHKLEWKVKNHNNSSFTLFFKKMKKNKFLKNWKIWNYFVCKMF